MSPLLLENVNTKHKAIGNSGLGTLPGPMATSTFLTDTSAVLWSTPRKAQELRDQLTLFRRLEEGQSTQRLLFRKVEKAFDEKDIQLAIANQKVRSLEAQLEAARPKKRRKVKTSPNSKFANIEAIRRAQIEAGEVENEPDESDGSEIPGDEADCIIVGVGRAGN